VPRDPFDAAPLRYNASRRLLWSVGDNGIEERKGPALGKYGGLNDWMYPVPDFGRTTH
jgi:hypothetical protein